MIPFAAPQAWGAEQKTVYFYYGQGCPHCTKVEAFFKENDIYDKYSIEKREIYFNRSYEAAFNADMDRLNVPESERGVPVIVAGRNYLIGDKPIIDSFVAIAKDYRKQIVAGEASANDEQKGIFAKYGGQIIAVAAASVLGATILYGVRRARR